MPPRPSSASTAYPGTSRSEEHTSELQSQSNLVCRLLLEKKKTTTGAHHAVWALPPGESAAPVSECEHRSLRRRCSCRGVHQRPYRCLPGDVRLLSHLDVH